MDLELVADNQDMDKDCKEVILEDKVEVIAHQLIMFEMIIQDSNSKQ